MANNNFDPKRFLQEDSGSFDPEKFLLASSFDPEKFLGEKLTPSFSSESFRPTAESFKSTLGQMDVRQNRLQKPFNLRPDQTVRPPPGPFALQSPYAKLPEIAGKAILKAPLSYAKGLGGQIQKVQELPLPGGVPEREGEPFLSGKMIADYWDDKLKKLQPNVKPDSPEAYADMMLTSVAQNVPLIVASSLGLSMPAAIKKLGLTATAINNLGLAGMGLTAGGTKYSDIRKAGVPAEKARLVSDIVGISEAGTEKLGFDKLMKPGLRFAKRLVLSAGLDVPGELINTAVESALDKVTINKEMTWTDLGKSLADTAIVALGSAGLVTAIAHPLIAVPEAMKRDEQNIKTKAAVDKYVAESMPSIREQIPRFGSTTDKAPTVDFPLFTPTTPQIQPEATERPVADATIALEAGEAERIRVEEAKATLLKNITERGARGIGYATVDGKLSTIQGNAGGAFVKAKEGGGSFRDTHLNVELTKEQKKRFAVLETDVSFAETPEERMASKKAMADFLLPIAKDILGIETLPEDISEQRSPITKTGVPVAQQTVSEYPKAQLDEMADILRHEALQNYEIVKSDDLLDKISKVGKINNRFFKGKEETKTIRPYIKMKAFTADPTAGDMDDVADMLGMTDVELLDALNSYRPISKPSEKLADYQAEAEYILGQLEPEKKPGKALLSDYEPGLAESETGYGKKEQGELFDVPQESIQQRYDRYKKIAKEQGFDQRQTEKYAMGELAKAVKAKPGVPAAVKSVQTEFKGPGVAKFGEDTTDMLPFEENKIAETLVQYGNPPHNEVTAKQTKILQAINPDRPTLNNFFTSNKQNGADLRAMVSNAMTEGIPDEQLIPQVKQLLGIEEPGVPYGEDKLKYRKTIEAVESREERESPYEPQFKSIEKAIVAMTEQGERIEKLAEAITAKTEEKIVEGKVLPKLLGGEGIEEAAAKYTSADMLVSTEPTINTKKDMQITDISGNKVSLPAGTAIIPRLIKGGKYVITADTDDYVLSKNQYENLKSQSVKGEAKEFAPELEGTEEVIKEEDVDFKTSEEGEDLSVKFSQTVPAGMSIGKNYREILVKLPITKTMPRRIWIMYDVSGKVIGRPVGGETAEKAIKLFNMFYGEERGVAVRVEKEIFEFDEPDFSSPHWKEPNILFHNRFADFTTPDGEKVVVWIEGQSDWAREFRQKGDRVEYEKLEKRRAELELKGENALPEEKQEWADIKNKLQKIKEGGIAHHSLLKNWQILAAKRALIEAVNSNADYLALVTGEQTADMYDLGKQVDKVVYSKNNDGTYSIGYIQKGLEWVDSDARMTNIKENEIQNIVGKNIAEKIINGEGVLRKTNEKLKELQGNDLKVGGEWAKSLYDRQFPNILKDLTGAEIEIIKLKNKSGLSPLSQPAIRITPEIRAIVKGEAPQLRQPDRVSPFTIKEGQSSYYADLFPETRVKPKPGLPAGQPGEAEITGSPMAFKLKQTGSLLMANETLRDPTDVAFMVDTLHGETIETFFIGALDGNNKPLGVMYVGIGSIRSGEVNTYDVVTILNKLGAKRFYTGHNHPGGDMNFSDDDMRLTKKLKQEMGKLGFEFTGHVLWDHQKVVGYLDADLKYSRVNIPQAVTAKGEVGVFKGYQEWLDGKSAEDLPALDGPTKVFEVLKNIQTDTKGNLVVIYMNNQLKNMGVEVIPNKEYSVARIIKNATAVRANNVIVGGGESMEISSAELKSGLAEHEIKLRDIISIMPENKFSSAQHDGLLAEEEVKYGELEDLKESEAEWDKKEPPSGVLVGARDLIKYGLGTKRERWESIAGKEKGRKIFEKLRLLDRALNNMLAGIEQRNKIIFAGIDKKTRTEIFEVLKGVRIINPDGSLEFGALQPAGLEKGAQEGQLLIDGRVMGKEGQSYRVVDTEKEYNELVRRVPKAKEIIEKYLANEEEIKTSKMGIDLAAFSREVMKHQYDIKTVHPVEFSYVPSVVKEKRLFAKISNLFKSYTPSGRKRKTGALAETGGEEKDILKTVTMKQQEFAIEDLNNNTIGDILAMVLKPIEGGKVQPGYIAVNINNPRMAKIIEMKKTLLKANGIDPDKASMFQYPNEVERELKIQGTVKFSNPEMQEAYNHFKRGSSGVINTITTNYLLRPSTANRNFVSGLIQYTLKPLTHLYEGNLRGIYEDIKALGVSLAPSVRKELPAEILGSTFYSDIGRRKSIFSYFLAPFRAVETYFKRASFSADLNTAANKKYAEDRKAGLFTPKAGLPTNKSQYIEDFRRNFFLDMFQELSDNADSTTYDYWNKPLFLQKLNKGLVPFPNYIYHKFRFYSEYSPLGLWGLGKNAGDTTKRKVAKMMAGLTLMAMVWPLVNRAVEKRRKQLEELAMRRIDLKFDTTGRLLFYTDKDTENWLRVYDWPVLGDMLYYREINAGSAEIGDWVTDALALGPFLKVPMTLMGLKSKYEAGKPTTAILGRQVAGWIPFGAYIRLQRIMADPIKRETASRDYSAFENFINPIKNVFPGISKTIPADVAITGANKGKIKKYNISAETMKLLFLNVKSIDKEEYAQYVLDQYTSGKREKRIKAAARKAGEPQPLPDRKNRERRAARERIKPGLPRPR